MFNKQKVNPRETQDVTPKAQARGPQKPTWSERINKQLSEPSGKIFENGKWWFWFPFLLILQILNAALTVTIFASNGGGWQTYVSAVMLGLGGALCWLCVGALHYSGSEDSRMARRVSLLDSITLCFAIAHFCFLFWAQGHMLTLRGAEEKYEARATTYNDKLKDFSTDNVKIAQSVERAEKLRNDTAYQQRKAQERGAQIKTSAGGAASLSTTPIELEKPKAPEKSSAAFLLEWDSWIRAAQFGELILAAITYIYIRNRSAAFNAQSAPERVLPVATGRESQPATAAALRSPVTQKTTPVATEGGRFEALKALRDHLRVIASYLPGRAFKADLIEPEGVWIRLYESRAGKEKMLAKTKQSDKILAAVDRPDFPERLRAELIACGFPIGGE